jgi:hypothetical protein
VTCTIFFKITDICEGLLGAMLTKRYGRRTRNVSGRHNAQPEGDCSIGGTGIGKVAGTGVTGSGRRRDTNRLVNLYDC